MRRDASPVPTGKGQGLLTINKLSSQNKTLRPILERICESGSIPETEMFSFFCNRKQAIDAIRNLTNGKYRILDSRVQNGERIYFCSDYTCQNRLTCGRCQP